MKKIYALLVCLCITIFTNYSIAQNGSSAIGVTVAGGNGVGSALNQLTPKDVVVDASNNIYVMDGANGRVLKFAPGATVGIIVAGGNGGGSAANQIGFGSGITLDAANNLYIADYSNNRVQKWTPGATEGITVAGGPGGFLASPQAVSVDAAGNLYVLEYYNTRIFKYAPGSTTGVIVVSSNGLSSPGVTTNFPDDFFVDAAGNIYVIDKFNSRILKWTPGAASSVVVAGGNGGGGAANQLQGPTGIFVDASGSIFVADANNGRIQKWLPGATSGITVAGGNDAGTGANQLSSPNAIFVDAAGNMYVSDAGNNRIQKFSIPVAQGSPATGVTVAGGNGSGTALNQASATDVVVDALNNVYVLDMPNYRVLKYAPNATEGVVVAGGNGRGTGANQFVTSYGIAVDALSNVYVADYSNYGVKRWAPGATEGVTVAYTNGPGGSATPKSVVVDAMNNVYVLDYYNTRILKYVPGSLDGVTIVSSSGLSAQNIGTNFPDDFFIDAAGNVYVIDRPFNRVVRWTPGAGSGIVVAGGNGSGSAANQLNSPSGVFVDAAGNVFVADTYNNRIQKWAPGAVGGVTVAGGNGQGAGATQLSLPRAVFVDSYGNIYVGDEGNSRVQKFGNNTIGGLYYKYYEGSFNALPDFSALTPVKTGNSSNVDISVRTLGRNDNFAFLWEGRIKIPTAGNYTFETVSDDGSRLYFNSQYSAGATATINNDGIHPATPVTANVNIPAAGAYPIAISYFEKDGGQSMQVYWTGPGIARQLIPNSAFVSSGTGDNIAPGIPANVHVVSKGGSYINLDWDNSTDNVGVTAYEVYVNGIKKYTTTESLVNATSLSPNTSYSFTVRALDLAGNASAFSTAVVESTSASSGGLSYKYFEGTWNSLPDFTTLTPVKTGNTPNVDISVRTAGRDDNFAFVWEGYINITTPGNYTFETVSDDGSKLYFNSLYVPSATATVNNDGLHAAVSAKGTINIPTAGSYPISITYFEKDGGESMQVFWTGPGIARQLIPDAAFTQSVQGSNLNYRYYEGTSWTKLPDFSSLTPVKTGTSANVNIGVRPAGVNDNFGFVWEGYINIPAPGSYTFETVSDDGSKLYFNSLYSQSATALVNNDGQHAPTSATGTVNITAAGIYPIAFTYFEKDGGEAMQVYWSGPGIAKQLIPDAAFVPNVPQSSGVTYKYYQGTWTTLPDFTALTPVKTGNAPNIDISVRPAGVNDNFGFVWEGHINIPSAGNYTFETISDDGSKLYFNQTYSSAATPLVSNDGLHAATSATGTVYIPAAGSYPIAVTYFEKDGGESMQVYWSGPGIARQLIPNVAFVQPVPLLSAASNVTGENILTGNTSIDLNNGNIKISKVYPDPFIDRFKIEFYNSSASNDISVSVRDINGRLVYTHRAGKLVAGNNALVVPLEGTKLTNGIYMVTLNVNGIASKTLSLLRTNR